MAFKQKTWVDRQTEYPSRRRLVATSEANVYDVEREEGLEIETGDAFNAATMNELERRIAGGFDDAKAVTVDETLLASNWEGTDAPFTYSLELEGVTATSIQEFIPAVGITASELEALQAANIVDGGQTEGVITLVAWGTVPVVNIPIRIIQRGDF